MESVSSNQSKSEKNSKSSKGSKASEEIKADEAKTEESESKEPLDEHQAKLDDLQKELDSYKDKYLRAAADMENMRRRFDKEKSDLLKYGLEKVFEEMLPVLDSFDKAMTAHAEAEDNQSESAQNSFVAGIELVQKQIQAVLSKHGLEAFESKGKEFDPNLHQAIQKIDSDEVEQETVKDEFVKGYRLNGRLLRAAMVSVAIPTKK